MKWRIASDPAIRFRIWDDEAVAYHGASGSTHLLGPAAVLLIRHLQTHGETDIAVLVQSMANEWQIDESDTLSKDVELVLSDLQSLELVMAVPC